MHPIVSKYLFYLPATLGRGENVLRLLPKKRESQLWDATTVRDYQAANIRALLNTAREHSEFYASSIDLALMPRQSSGSRAFFDWFQSIPYLTKQDLVQNENKLRTFTSKLVSSKTTGGSTGEPVRLWKNAYALAHERASTWRAYEWAGVGIGHKQLRFWGIPLTREAQWKSAVVDVISNRRRISAFDLTEESLSRHHAVMMKFRPAYLYGYASVIRIFADFITTNKLVVPSTLRSVITTSEVLTDIARSTIEDCFDVPIFNEYGCGEVGSIAHECKNGRMHVMSDNVYLELDSSDTSELGEIIVTDLHNTEMPLIRYRLGDFASWEHEECSCGVRLPSLQGIHGRAYDIVRTSSGKELHPEAVMYIFEQLQSETKAFRHFQAIQTRIDHYQINVVPAATWSPAVEAALAELVRKHIDPKASLSVSEVSEIPRERSGKLRVVKSLISGT